MLQLIIIILKKSSNLNLALAEDFLSELSKVPVFLVMATDQLNILYRK